MDSKKRFTNNFIWDSKLFQLLEKGEKLFYFYLMAKCDNIGYWDPNFQLAKFHVGEFDEEVFLKKINDGKKRIIILEDGAWFLTSFTKFQYSQTKPLNPKNPAHKSYIHLMMERNLYDWFIENEPNMMEKARQYVGKKRGLNRVFETSKEKEANKGKNSEFDITNDTQDFYEESRSQHMNEHVMGLESSLRNMYEGKFLEPPSLGIYLALKKLLGDTLEFNCGSPEVEIFDSIESAIHEANGEKIDIIEVLNTTKLGLLS